MKVKDFLEWFEYFDPEKELKFELFEEIVDINGNYRERWTELSAEELNCIDEDGNVHLTLAWCDWKDKRWRLKIYKN